jgi:valyl-tRNA synthetase
MRSMHGGEMQFSLADRWIQSQPAGGHPRRPPTLDTYRFDRRPGVLYEFIWNQFCDWYLELTKPVLGTSGLEAASAAPVAPW